MAKEEPEYDLCRCCHAEGSYKNLYASYCWMEVEEVVYFNMLQECFDIEMTPVSEALQHMLCAICDTCIDKLHDAIKFKRQIQKCERRFRDVYGTCTGAEPSFEVKIKQEIEVDVKEDPAQCPDEQPACGPTTSKMAKQFDTLLEDDDEDGTRGWSDDDNFPIKPTKSAPKAKAKKTPAAPKDPNKTRTGKGVKRKRTKNTASAECSDANSGDLAEKIGQDGEQEEIETIDGLTFIRVKNPKIRRGVDFEDTKDGVQCVKCSVIAESFKKLRKHILRIHKSNVILGTYRCPICVEIFWKRAALAEHKLMIHNIDQRLKCSVCDKAFDTRDRMQNHMQTFHKLGKKWKCNECKYETYNDVYFMKHKRNHSAEKIFQCQYCLKMFKRQSTLTLHERIHTGDKRKVCTECGQAFVQRASLKYHMLKHHPGVHF